MDSTEPGDFNVYNKEALEQLQQSLYNEVDPVGDTVVRLLNKRTLASQLPVINIISPLQEIASILWSILAQ